MTGPARYEIHTVLDFLKVPRKRRAACLRDFKKYLSMADDLRSHVAAALGVAVEHGNRFVWVDDGVVGLSQVNIVSGGKTVLSITAEPEAPASGETQFGDTGDSLKPDLGTP